MPTLDIFKQQADEVLRLEIAYSNLYQVYVSGDREEMIKFYIAAKQVLPNFNAKVLNESRKVFYSRGCHPDNIPHPIEQVQTEQLKLNVEGCLNALKLELNQRNIYQTNYTYAQKTLYHPFHIFSQEEILYKDQSGRQLKVSDFLAVSKYAISIAEAIEPDNEEYAKASAVITTLQGIDARLNNKPEDKPVNKMLHLVNSFISSVVKSSLINREEKREVTVTATMIDLVIDFFCAK